MRINFYSIIILVLLQLYLFSCSNNSIFLTSPDGNIQLSFKLKSYKSDYNYPVYRLSYKNRTILSDCELGVVFKKSGIFKYNLIIDKITFDEKDETYSLALEKTATARNYYKEVKISLAERNLPDRRIDFFFRAYNDGVAFRYIFPKQDSLLDFIITDELSTFNIEQDVVAYSLLWDKYENNHEGNYSIMPLKSIPVDTLIDLPLLLEFPDSIWLAITEANLTDYASMYLSPLPNRKSVLKSKLSPHINKSEIKAKAKTPHYSPWRVMMISDNIGKLIESNIIMNLNEPCEFDASWIKPGKSTWHWWNGTIGEQLNFELDMDFKTMKYYIDFCAANNIEFHSLVKVNKKNWYNYEQIPVSDSLADPDFYADVTSPIPELQINKLIQYAKDKGVGLRLWTHWVPLSKRLEQAFALYESWSIEGLMVDLMDRDDQEMVNFYHKVLKLAAKHHLKIQFHGAYKPTGSRRTYPNIEAREAVLNLEWNKWSDKCHPEHNLIVPFTRMLAGPLDYHLGGFRSIPIEEFEPKYVSPNVIGTRCHHLAMYVVYQSCLQLVCDYPSSYVNQPGFEFIQQVPTTWDDTKVINAKVGDYITIARKKGKNWWLGSMTDWTAREISIKLDFLPKGNYVAVIYSDTEDADRFPNKLHKEKIMVTNNDILKCKMVSGGGQSIRISPVENSANLGFHN